MRLTPDARISFGLMALSLAALGAFFWLGFRPLPSRFKLRETDLSRSVSADAGTRFVDVTERVGLYDFRHDSGGLDSIQDAVAPGLGLLDLDMDADLDLVLLGGPHAGPGVSIFLNQLHELGRLTFEDVTPATGITWSGAAQGVCAGDYDNDGDVDLFVTVLGPNLLLQNQIANGGGLTFVDVTETAGVAGGLYYHRPGRDDSEPGEILPGRPPIDPIPAVPRREERIPEPVPEFSTGASFGDYDGDTHLDLFVANYVSYHPQLHRNLASPQDRTDPVAFQPRPFPPQQDRLYHNRGDGTFEEVTEPAGITDSGGRGMSAVFVQLDDRWPDLYVANDASRNALYRNLGPASRGPRHFIEAATNLGVADVRSAMGVASGDPDADGDLDLLITNWRDEPVNLYLSYQSSFPDPETGSLTMFDDSCQAFGLVKTTAPYVGWGAVFFDYDLDGYQDVIIANGFTSPLNNSLLCGPEPLILLRNNRGRGLIEVSSSAGDPFHEKYQARGLVVGDLDADLDLDVVLAQNNGRVVVLLNELPAGGGRLWTRPLRLDGIHRGDAIGARVLLQYGPLSQIQEVVSGGSYLSQGPLSPSFGVGDVRRVDQVQIIWPYPWIPDVFLEDDPVPSRSSRP